MKILFVDDRTKRIHWALKEYKDHDLTIATNVLEALRQLSANDFDVVSLDHDLTGCDFEDPDTKTCGMEVVRYIEKCGWPNERNKPEFIIHSSNLFAAHLMIVRLRGMAFKAYGSRIVYPVEHMTYTKEGLPK